MPCARYQGKSGACSFWDVGSRARERLTEPQVKESTSTHAHAHTHAYMHMCKSELTEAFNCIQMSTCGFITLQFWESTFSN